MGNRNVNYTLRIRSNPFAIVARGLEIWILKSLNFVAEKRSSGSDGREPLV